VYTKVPKGEAKLTAPENCPDAVVRLIHRCTAVKPEDRPTFGEIVSELRSGGSKSHYTVPMEDNEDDGNYQTLPNNHHYSKTEL
jgi:hypothetical protein